jgi:hypothetical protein
MFVLAIYAWMSTALQFAHTDDLQGFATGPAAQSSPLGHYSAAPAPEGPCLACEWTAATHSSSIASTEIRFEQQIMATYNRPVPSALHLSCFDHALLRGPPQHIS